ncbi:hypothetical protein QLQ09_24175 [Brucella sp. NM4]|uniref:hypothetical protein n=1 Tax=Brucella sp. NM4 TaxID=3045175 RepID=UPI0024BC984B|nr:hypothetical protein [Brucella sp. NM4]WHS33925.1 hypothetical protein QLQ09_24175 [Brucella sp. NM4]
MRALYFSLALTITDGPALAQNATFDVFGVHIGDTPTVVESAMTEKGFSKFREDRGPSLTNTSR